MYVEILRIFNNIQKAYRWHAVGDGPGEKDPGEHLEGSQYHIGLYQSQGTMQDLLNVGHNFKTRFMCCKVSFNFIYIVVIGNMWYMV